MGHFFFFQAEDGIRDLVRSRGLGDVYKRQPDDPDEDDAKVAVAGRRTDQPRDDCQHEEEQRDLSLIHI